MKQKTLEKAPHLQTLETHGVMVGHYINQPKRIGRVPMELAAKLQTYNVTDLDNGNILVTSFQKCTAAIQHDYYRGLGRYRRLYVSFELTLAELELALFKFN